MSNQWEVVTKSKRNKHVKESKLGQAERKKMIEEGPKLEEIFPSEQIQMLISSSSKKSNTVVVKDKKATTNKKEKKSVNEANKNAHGGASGDSPKNMPNAIEKNVASKSSQQDSSGTKQNKPKNLEGALLSISVQELEDHLQALKDRYPDGELVWLKGICSFLNAQLPLETDPIFSGKTDQYPSNIIPKDLKSSLVNILKSMNEVTVFYFFDQLFTLVAVDMARNQPTVAPKILLQLIARLWPKVCCKDIAKSVILRNSYQNRSPIGLSLLWALGQGGYEDPNVGMKVWLDFMVPLMELKSYTKFVCNYILKTLKIAKSKDLRLYLSNDEFNSCYNALRTSFNGLPKDCQEMLKESSFLLIEKHIETAPKLQYLFTNFLRSIQNLNNTNQIEVFACISALRKSSDCFKVWKMNYKKNILSSCAIFKAIYKDWDNEENSLKSSSEFYDFLDDLTKLNEEIMNGKKNDANLPEVIKLIKNLQDKPSQKKKSTTKGSSSLCFWLLGIFVLIGAIGGVISYDVHMHNGVFEKSATGKFLKDTGALPYVETAWYKTMSTSARGYKWTEENVPVYYQQAKVFLKPYTSLACDLFKVSLNAVLNVCENVKDYAQSKTPVLVEFIEQYVPGLPKKIQDVSVSAWDTSVTIYNSGCDFFKTKVFVGSLSPENLSNALNQTQIAAAKYYSWFHEKVDAYAKIK